MTDLLTVVGIGAGGWDDLPGTHRAALTEAEVILGGPRQLSLLPPAVAGSRVEWPSPLVPALPGLLETHRGRRVCVLASGDPMFHGIGATLARLAPLRVLPHPSSVSLAAARMGWALQDVDVVSLVTAPVATLRSSLNPGRRVLVLGGSPVEVASLLDPACEMTVLSQLGGPQEHVGDWDGDPLHVIAIECGPSVERTPVTPGLPDELYESDGQLTKREVRAVTMAALGPAPGELLWDVGAGSGSIGIEWMRAHRSCRAIAIEPLRSPLIRANAGRLGVPGLRVVEGRAPAALSGLPRPDAVFIGGGLTTDGVVDACLEALPLGGRLVANAVTLESEAVLAGLHAKLGGSLTRLSVQRAAPVGGFTGWRPMMPVTIWAVRKS